MKWLINFLRLKVNDEGVTTLDPDQYYAGDSIKLTCEYTDMAGAPADPNLPTVTIWDSMGKVIIDKATPVDSGVIGVRYYIYGIPEDGPKGVWRAEFTGSIDGNVSKHPIEFDVVTSKRIWTDEELQDILDLNRIHVRRELLTKDSDRKKYYSQYGMFEDDVILWDSVTSNAKIVSPSSSSLVDGTFVFDTEQNGVYYLDGKSYNIHGAIAECMEQLAMDPNRARAWERGGVKYTQYDLFEMSKYHRNLAGTRTAKTIRTYS